MPPLAQSPSSDLAARLATSGSGLLIATEGALPDDTEQLWGNAGNADVFNHPAWWNAAIAAFAGRRRFRVVTIRHEGRLLAVWPLWIKRLGFKEGLVKVLEPVGARVTDYCTPLILRDQPVDILLELLLREATSHLDAATVMLWPKAPREMVEPERLGAWCRTAGLLVDQISRPCLAMSLPTDYADLEKRWSKSHRGDIKRQIKRLSQAGSLDLVTIGDRDGMVAMLPGFYAMHSANWRARTGAAEFENGPMARFVDQLARTLPLEMLDVSELRLGTAPIAYHFGFRHRRRLLWYKPTFDVAWANYAPGKVHVALATRNAIDRGDAHVDFMQGTEPYKRQWSDIEAGTTSFVIANRAGGAAWAWTTKVRKFAAEYRY